MPTHLIMRGEVSFLPKLKGDFGIRILYDSSPAGLCFKRFYLYIMVLPMICLPGQNGNKGRT